MSQNHVNKILEVVTPEILGDRLGMSDRSIEHAKYVGYFSGLWFDEVERLCIEHGIPCPRAAFNWKTPPKKRVTVPTAIQDQPSEKVNAASDGGAA